MPLPDAAADLSTGRLNCRVLQLKEKEALLSCLLHLQASIAIVASLILANWPMIPFGI